MKINSRPKTSSITDKFIDVCYFEGDRMIGGIPNQYKKTVMFGKPSTVFYIEKKDIITFITESLAEYDIEFLIESYGSSKTYSAFLIKKALLSIKEEVSKKTQKIEVLEKESEAVVSITETTEEVKEVKKAKTTKQPKNKVQEEDAQQVENDRF